MTAEEREDRLAEVAAQMAGRVRWYGPDDNAIWLQHELPDPQDQYALLFVLAAAVPIDERWSDLVAWARPGVREVVCERFRLDPAA